MITLTGINVTTHWCVYTLHDQYGKLVFIWTSKIATCMNWRDVLSNPAFDLKQSYTFKIISLHNTGREAQGVLNTYMRANPMPDLNKTIRWNRRTRVMCMETGRIWRNQADCAKELGINQAQLSQHLRRNPGYRSIKGMTYNNIADEGAVKPVHYPSAPMPPVQPLAAAVPPVPPSGCYRVKRIDCPGGNVILRHTAVSVAEFDSLPEAERFYSADGRVPRAISAKGELQW